MTPNTQESIPHTTSDLWASLIRLHDHVFSDNYNSGLKRLVVRLGIAGFVIHLLLVTLVRVIPTPPAVLAAVGTNYLSVIATPFNFILFYEVLTLIAAVPASTTRSIGNQFEIVSLVFIREVFSDFAEATEPNWIASHPRTGLPVLFDMGTGVLMYLLVTVFQHVASRQVEMPRTPGLTRSRALFVSQKKIVALCLTILLLGLAGWHLGEFLSAVWQATRSGSTEALHSTGFFYNDLFNVMIFTDVLVLILSLIISGRYEMVFRNAAFVVSIILIRFSMTEERPYGAIIALVSMLFGILTLLIFNYHSHLRAAELLERTKASDH